MFNFGDTWIDLLTTRLNIKVNLPSPMKNLTGPHSAIFHLKLQKTVTQPAALMFTFSLQTGVDTGTSLISFHVSEIIQTVILINFDFIIFKNKTVSIFT